MAIVFLVGISAAACGGNKNDAAEPRGGGDDSVGEAPKGVYIVSEEKMDTIQTYLGRKQSGRTISDCWVKALDAGEAKDNSRGSITLNFTIQTDGHIGNIKTSSLQPAGAKTFESCVVDKMKTWTVTPLEHPFDTSYTFAAGEL